MEQIFSAEHLVILTSKIAIQALQWRKYVLDNWSKLMRKNTRFLVLAGIHGNKDGQLGSPDSGLLRDYQKQVNFMCKKFKDKMEQDNIQIFVEDISTHVDDHEKLVNAIKDHNPTILSLAFCYTNVSALNDILRAAGIYTVMIMSQDRAEITEGKYVILDNEQRTLVEQVASEQPQNVFLWGSSGTGKTLILTQVLSMKISYFKKNAIKYKVFVTSHLATNPDSLLIHDFRNKYIPTQMKDENLQIVHFLELSQEANIYRDRTQIPPEKYVDDINEHCEKLALKYPEHQVVLLIDEIFPSIKNDSLEKVSDWSKLHTKIDNLHLLLSLSPQLVEVKSTATFKVIPPGNTLSRQLLTKHRNCLEILNLMDYFRHSNPFDGFLDPSKDTEVLQDTIPPGRLPIWISASEKFEEQEILSYIKSKYIQDHESVTLLNAYDCTDSVRDWCQDHGWRICSYVNVNGCEDQVIVSMRCNPTFELISRARNAIIFITSNSSRKTWGQKTQSKFENFFEKALLHQDEGYTCQSCAELNKICPFKGKELFIKEKLGVQMVMAAVINWLYSRFVSKPSKELFKEIMENEEIVDLAERIYLLDTLGTQHLDFTNILQEKLLKLLEEYQEFKDMNVKYLKENGFHTADSRALKALNLKRDSILSGLDADKPTPGYSPEDNLTHLISKAYESYDRNTFIDIYYITKTSDFKHVSLKTTW